MQSKEYQKYYLKFGFSNATAGMKLQLLTDKYLPYFESLQVYTLQKHFNKLKKKALQNDSFDFYWSSSAVYSSIIEGNPISIESYWKYREFDINTRSKPYKEIQDLIKAYQFAQENSISWRSVMKAHKTLSNHLLKEAKKYQGKVRDSSVGIYEDGKVLVYMAAETAIVKDELKKLMADIKTLVKADLSINDCFYFASMIHLRFSQIHPFADGNGRTARLLEKWFLVQKLGKSAWLIESEKYYQKSIVRYYKNINLGKTYTALDYDKCLPFVLMLPDALRFS